jgi:NAD-dependent SIR2 family protein deacetylase
MDKDYDFECNCCGQRFDEDPMMRGEIWPRKPDKCPVCKAPRSEIRYVSDIEAVVFF